MALIPKHLGKTNVSAVRSRIVFDKFEDRFFFFPLLPPPSPLPTTPLHQCSAELDEEEIKAYAALDEELIKEMCNAIEADCQSQAR